jgi:7-cyano-7-deazaguanine reductase
MSESPKPKTMSDYASKSLGDSTSYAVYTDKYDPSLLVKMPRDLARKDWGIDGNSFWGYDVWNCHEATFLTYNGIPLAGTLKIVYPSTSEWMVESKSLKLFLNTFDMCKMGPDFESASINYEETVEQELRKLLGTTVEACFFYHPGAVSITKGYRDMLDSIDENIIITDYSGGSHLRGDVCEGTQSQLLYTTVLRSRCRHTKQKDTGSAYFHIKNKEGHVVNVESLFRQVVSLREVNEFHEFCAEELLTEIMSLDGVEDACVMLLYARRGSLDINPVRASNISLIPQALINAQILVEKTLGQ